jgi:hypothetical protein
LDALRHIMADELALFYQKKNNLRFLIELSAALLSAIVGESIAGNTLTGQGQFVIIIFGAIAYFTFSFIGVYKLFSERFNPDYAFKLKLLDDLSRLEPSELDFFESRLLDKDIIYAFLNYLFDKQERGERVFIQKTIQEEHKEQWVRYADQLISFLSAAIYSPIYIENGFRGLNALSRGRLLTMKQYQKILLGFLCGLPLISFIHFSVKTLQAPMLKNFNEMPKDWRSLLYALTVMLFCLGSSTWSFVLAKELAEQDTIFYPLLDGQYGTYVFPVFAYYSIVNIALNSLSFSLAKKQYLNPTAENLVRSIGTILPNESIKSLRTHRFFRPVSNIELINTAEDRHEEPLQLA